MSNHNLSAFDQLLKELLLSRQPSSVLHVGQASNALIASYCEKTGCELLHAANSHAVELTEKIPDFVLVSNCLEYESFENGQQLLATLRNFLIPTLLVTIAENTKRDWTLNKMLELGFKRLLKEPRGLTCYAYQLENYNPKRHWNTPENWANPEMFDKHRW